VGQRPKKRPKEMAHSTACKLIGEFVFHWNLLEASLNEAIVSLSKLDQLHGVIITANLQFQTKMHIITTLIDFLGRSKPKAWKDAAAETIRAIHKINNEWRTLVVHNLIAPIDTKKVKFLKVSAKKKLHWPDTTKTKQQFQEVYRDMLETMTAVKKITEDLSSTKVSAMVKALLAAPPSAPFGFAPPTLGLAALGQSPGLWQHSTLGKGAGGILGAFFPKAPDEGN
jgi:hypothetical protein